MNVKVNKKNGIRLKTKNKLLKEDIVITTGDELVQPEGNIEIKSTKEYNVANYETAQIVSDTLLPENIIKGVNILGVSGGNDSPKIAELYSNIWKDFLSPDSFVGLEKEIFEGITSLRNYAFAYSDVNNVILPDTITSIGNNLCYQAKKLRYFHFSSNIFEVPSSCFSGCEKLDTLSNYSHLTKIGNDAFYGCTNLMFNRKLIFKEGLTYIGDNAFNGCIKVSEIILPATLNHIGSGAFTNVGTQDSDQTIGGLSFKGTTPPAEIPNTSFLLNVQRVRVPTGSLAAYQAAFINSGFKGYWHERDPEDMK